MKLLISTPAYNHQVHNEMVLSLLRVMADLKENNISANWHSPTSSVLSFNRNLSVDRAIKEEYDWLLFWDADISVQEVSFVRDMIDTSYKYNTRVVGLPVALKGHPTTWNCAIKTTDGYANVGPGGCKDPFMRDVIGTGVMLIKVDLLKEMEPPWFSFVDTYKEQPGFFPEDWNFCEKSKEKIWVEPRFTVKHYGMCAYE